MGDHGRQVGPGTAVLRNFGCFLAISGSFHTHDAVFRDGFLNKMVMGGISGSRFRRLKRVSGLRNFAKK